MSNECSSQSQFCPMRVWRFALASGSTANDVHSAGVRACSSAARAFAANMISVRVLMASTSSNATSAPSATPCISSRYRTSKARTGST